MVKSLILRTTLSVPEVKDSFVSSIRQYSNRHGVKIPDSSISVHLHSSPDKVEKVGFVRISEDLLYDLLEEEDGTSWFNVTERAERLILEPRDRISLHSIHPHVKRNHHHNVLRCPKDVSIGAVSPFMLNDFYPRIEVVGEWMYLTYLRESKDAQMLMEIVDDPSFTFSPIKEEKILRQWSR